MTDMPSEIGCPHCGAYGFGCDCDRSELIEQRAAKQRRDSPGPTLTQWPYLPADAVARLGLTRPAEYIQMAPAGWEREVADSTRRWRQSRRSSCPDRLRATPWRPERGGIQRARIEAKQQARKAGW